MKFKFEDVEIFENKSNDIMEQNSYLIISKSPSAREKKFGDIIQFIDEDGTEMNFTIDKFVEIFDKQGLSGFIL